MHFLYCEHGRVGIPARLYGSLIYGQKFTDVTPLQRIQELTMMFKDFYDRSCLPLNEDLVAADLSRAVSSRWARFNKAVAKIWLHIPKATGGFGLLPYQYYSFEEEKEQTRALYYTHNLYPLAPQRQFDSKAFKMNRIRLNNSFFKICKQQPYHIKNKAEWLDVISGEFKLVDKKSMLHGSETIPLPEIPFVSTNRMSYFAAKLGYNAISNVDGDRISVSTRLIKGSLLLVSQVKDILQRANIKVYV